MIILLNDILLEIFKFLTLCELYNCSQVCKKFNYVFKNELLWSKNLEKIQYLFDYKKLPSSSNLEKCKTYYDVNKLCLFWKFKRRIIHYYNIKELHLNAKNIVVIPSGIRQLVNLEILSLKNNRIMTIPNEIKFLKKLSTLDISYNFISNHNINVDLSTLENLKILKLDHNILNEIPFEIMNLPTIEYINLNNNHIKEFPLNFNLPDGLKYFDLSKNYITKLNRKTIKNIILTSPSTIINLSGNYLTSLSLKFINTLTHKYAINNLIT